MVFFFSYKYNIIQLLYYKTIIYKIKIINDFPTLNVIVCY